MGGSSSTEKDLECCACRCQSGCVGEEMSYPAPVPLVQDGLKEELSERAASPELQLSALSVTQIPSLSYSEDDKHVCSGYHGMPSTNGAPERIRRCDPDGVLLQSFLTSSDLGIVKIGFLRRLAFEGRRLPRRQAIPKDSFIKGNLLSRVLNDESKNNVWVVSYAWLTREHPDPTGVRLKELIAELDRLRAQNGDAVFIDYCCLPQNNFLHNAYKAGEGLPRGHPANRTHDEELCFQAAKVKMDIIFASDRSNVVVLPSILELVNCDNRLSKNTVPYCKRAWCYLELAIARYYHRLANEVPGTEDLDHKQFRECVLNGTMAVSCHADREILINMYSRFFLAKNANL